MNRILLIDRLRSVLENRQVKAALFHTYNFDPEFFENYLLPAFLPDLPFGDNKIQNAILWRRYHTRLPPTTVYCDFYGKSNTAPQLPYVVRPVDVARFFQEKHKTKSLSGCFHPKHSFLLLDDDSLVVLTGSNNLTASGWCSNLEVFSFIRLRNAESFPRDLKDAFADFVFKIQTDLVDEPEATEAEEFLGQFFRRQKYTGNVAVSPGSNEWSRPKDFPLFFSSLNGSFFHFIERLKNEYNRGEPFAEVEVVSPYYAASEQIVAKLRAATDTKEIRLAIPFAGIDTVAMDRTIFDAYKTLATWCRFSADPSSRGFRFNHSKIWRLKGRDQALTIVGSVNCTMAACVGLTDPVGQPSANLESAFVHVEPAHQWRPLLTADTQADHYDFNAEAQDDESGNGRFAGAVPKLAFCIDWSIGRLTCRNEDNAEIAGMILNGRRRIKIQPRQKVEILLVSNEILMLSDNLIIDFHFSGKTKQTWYYYVTQEGYQSKPVPFRIRLNDVQVLELWKDLGAKSAQAESKAHQFIEELLDAVCTEDGVVDDRTGLLARSTLNTMAAHLSALLNLAAWLDTKPANATERKLHEERLAYYLTTSNVDTVPGYLELMTEKHRKGELNSAFFWLILELLDRDIYRRAARTDALSPVKELLGKFAKQIRDLQKGLKFKDPRLTRSHLEWAAKELK